MAPGASELVNHWQCCGDSLESVGIFLRAGERYKVAFGIQETILIAIIAEPVPNEPCVDQPLL